MKDFMIGFWGFYTNLAGLLIFRYWGYGCTECSGKGTREVFSFTQQETATFECDICAGEGRLFVRHRVGSRVGMLLGTILAVVLLVALIALLVTLTYG